MLFVSKVTALFKTFLKDRILSQKVNLWSPIKKRKLLTWKDSGKVLKVSGMDQVKELQEDRSLLARLMVVFKSRPDQARSQGSDWAVRVFCGSEVFFCVRWHDASLFRKEHFEDHHNKAWW